MYYSWALINVSGTHVYLLWCCTKSAGVCSLDVRHVMLCCWHLGTVVLGSYIGLVCSFYFYCVLLPHYLANKDWLYRKNARVRTIKGSGQCEHFCTYTCRKMPMTTSKYQIFACLTRWGSEVCGSGNLASASVHGLRSKICVRRLLQYWSAVSPRPQWLL